MKSTQSASFGSNHLKVCSSDPGYTILEVIVGLAIFTGMVFLSTMALNEGLRQYQWIMEKGINFWENARYLWISRSAATAIDYYVHDRQDGWYPYFRGDQEMISYVSRAPLAGDYPVIVWIRNERQDDGSRALVYYEVPVYTDGAADIERKYTFGDYKKGNVIKLIKNIENVELSYYGFSLDDYRWTWSGQFSGKKRKLLPQTVKIVYNERETGQKKTLVLGINTNTFFKITYNEMQPQE